METESSIVVVGAGVFGVTAALELRRRGHRVQLVDPGPLPHPDAASTDLSKAVRMDYGSDELYAALAERAIAGWHGWNRSWDRALYHEVGFLVLSRKPMLPGSYEHDGFELLRRRGQPVERLQPRRLGQRYPAWSAAPIADGYFNRRGGWAESGRVMSRLIRDAQDAGVVLHAGTGMKRLHEKGSRVAGIVTDRDVVMESDSVLVAAGAWTPVLLPHLSPMIRSTGHPALHLRPDDPEPYRADRFPVFAADISTTGWYGFPLHPTGVLKLANHGPGQPIDPRQPRCVGPEWAGRCRAFLAEMLPSLAGATLVESRLCLYCDTCDGDFLIDRDPDRDGLVVAAGGSGHGFKFAPVLGEIAADVVEGRPDPYAGRFAWRAADRPGCEQARHDPQRPRSG